MIKHSNFHKKQSGFSIIELMVASLIGLLILAGAVTVFSSNNSSGSLSIGMSRVQESGRVAMDILANDVRMAGYQGCANTATVSASVIANNRPTINFPETALSAAEVFTDRWRPAVPADLNSLVGRALPNTDVIYVQHGSGRSTMLRNDMATPADGNLQLLANPDQLATTDLVMVADCTSVDIFRATAVSNTPASVSYAATLNSRGNLSKAYRVNGGGLTADPMRVMRFAANAYYVANTGRIDATGTQIPALFVLDLSQPNGVSIELVEGVENLQLLYGQQVNDNIRYTSASDANFSLSSVISVQIGLLINSIDLVSDQDDTRTYLVADQQIGAPTSGAAITHSGSKRLRTAFNTTVRLRNR